MAILLNILHALNRFGDNLLGNLDFDQQITCVVREINFTLNQMKQSKRLCHETVRGETSGWPQQLY